MQKDGAFTLEAMPPGSYEVMATGQQTQFSIVRMAAEGALIEGRTLRLGSTSTDLAIVVTPDSASVKGFARQNGKPARGVMVVLVPHNPESNGVLFRRDESNSDGSFLLSHVAPGDYTLIAVDDGWSLEWARPEVIARYLPRGVRINIALSQKVVTLTESIEAQPR